MNILVAGEGVGKRLHVPVWEQHGASVEHVRLPDKGGVKHFRILDESPDLVIIATPPHRHLDHLTDCLHIWSGVPILVEKPVGLKADPLRSLVQERPIACSHVRVNYQLRYHPLIQYVTSHRSLVERSSSIDLVYESSAGFTTHVPSWYMSQRSGGGILYAVVCHLIDLAMHIKVLTTTAHIMSGTILSPTVCATSLRATGSGGGCIVTIRAHTRCKQGRFVIGFRDAKERPVVTLDMVSSQMHFDASGREAAYSARYVPDAMRSVGKGPWRAGYEAFVEGFVLSSGFNDCAATLAEACRVHDILSELLKA